MKKLIPFFVFGTIASAQGQQVTIDVGDFPPAGAVILYGADEDVTNLTLDMGTTGSGQSFDFSNLQTDNVFEVGFYNPSDPEVVGGADFPTADLAVDQLAGIFAFVEVGTNTVDIIGLGGDFAEGFGLGGQFELSLPAQDPWTLFEFPANTSSPTLNDVALFEGRFPSNVLPTDLVAFLPAGTDSVEVIRSISYEANVVGDGTLTDPIAGTHQVIKMEVVEINEDSISTKTNGVWAGLDPIFIALAGIELTSTTYRTRFISKSLGYYVVDVTTDASGTPEEATFVSNAGECCTSVEEVVARGENVVYPNPTNDFVRVRTGGEVYQFNIFDMTGKQRSSQVLTVDNQQVNIEGLATGLYIYRMIDESGKVAHTSRLSVVK